MYGTDAATAVLAAFSTLLLTLGVGISLALLAYSLVWSLETRRLQAEFSRAAEDHIVAVRTTLASYLEPLDAIAASHAATDHFDRQAYRTFVTPASAPPGDQLARVDSARLPGAEGSV